MTASPKAKIVRVKIEKGQEGLYYATSPDLKGLLVADPTKAALIAAVPKAIEDLFEACETPMTVTELDEEGDCSWVAVPTFSDRRSVAVNS